jgi:hypothetical protein
VKAKDHTTSGFVFFVSDWRHSQSVQRMSFTTRGMYLELLCEQWQHGSIPATAEACADCFGGGRIAWKRAWPKLVVHFVHEKGRKSERLVNTKLKHLAHDRDRWLRAQREAGSRGGKRSWFKRLARQRATERALKARSDEPERTKVQVQSTHSRTNKLLVRTDEVPVPLYGDAVASRHTHPVENPEPESDHETPDRLASAVRTRTGSPTDEPDDAGRGVAGRDQRPDHRDRENVPDESGSPERRDASGEQPDPASAGPAGPTTAAAADDPAPQPSGSNGAGAALLQSTITDLRSKLGTTGLDAHRRRGR